MENTDATTKINLIANKQGFTLIELLVAMAIIGILAAISLPQYIAYRRGGIDTQMKSDVKNAAMAMESYYGVKYVYPTTPAEIAPFGFQQTQGDNLVINLITPTAYTVVGSKPAGTKPSFTYDSTTGQTN
jgi:prepilin-type N-terminal cleavage/methylation domain-containing protein